MEKILSVIIPTYNMEKYLNKCLDSLIIDKNCMERLEVLVINDGSKDSSLSIALTYHDRFPETFKIIDKENGNYGSCINRGLKEAKGKYIKILDADDYFDKNHFKEYVELLCRTDVDLILNNYKVVGENGNELYSISFDIESYMELSMEDNIKDYDLSKIRMHSIAYKKEILDRIGYVQTEKMSYTDQEWVFLPVIQCKTTIYFNNKLYCYLYGRQGQTMNTSCILKNISQLEAINFSLAYKYESVLGICSSFSKKYLEVKLSDQLRTIYNIYLSNKCLSRNKLRDFDKKIMNISKSAYHLADNFTINHGFKYINYLRLHNYYSTIVDFHLYINKRINILKNFFVKQDIY